MRPSYIYVAGPYTANSQEEINRNIERADETGKQLVMKGHYPFIPHKQTAQWEKDERLTYEHFIALDLAWIEVCDAIIMIGDWKNSNGAREEYYYAIRCGLTVYHSIDEVPIVSEVTKFGGRNSTDASERTS